MSVYDSFPYLKHDPVTHCWVLIAYSYSLRIQLLHNYKIVGTESWYFPFNLDKETLTWYKYCPNYSSGIFAMNRDEWLLEPTSYCVKV